MFTAHEHLELILSHLNISATNYTRARSNTTSPLQPSSDLTSLPTCACWQRELHARDRWRTSCKRVATRTRSSRVRRSRAREAAEVVRPSCGWIHRRSAADRKVINCSSGRKQSNLHGNTVRGFRVRTSSRTMVRSPLKGAAPNPGLLDPSSGTESGIRSKRTHLETKRGLQQSEPTPAAPPLHHCPPPELSPPPRTGPAPPRGETRHVQLRVTPEAR